VRKMRERGFLVSSIFYLMLAHEQECIAQLLHAVELVLGELDRLIDSGKLAGESGVAGLQCGFSRLT